VRSSAADIVARVRQEGDAALIALAAEFDGVHMESLEVPDARRRAARGRTPPRLLAALERAASNIAGVHRAFMPAPAEFTTADGVLVGRRAEPLDRVGVYAPGGRAAYPSSVLMGAVPARVAGVNEVIVCSPPAADGSPSDVVLAAASIAGADRVFAIGGAGAIAALAYGTATVPRVDRIVGPGNAYVAAAKMLVVDSVGIDAPAGPSELLVIADATADATVVAREVLAQAEHDPLAAVVVVAVATRLPEAIDEALQALLPREPRAAIIAESLAARGALLTARDIREAVAFAADYAPEHLLLAVADAERWLADVRHAGTVFLGERSSVAFGDYLTGANHVLPTGGLARAYSGLSTSDFMRWTTYQRVDAAAAARLADDVETLALSEQLPAHARAAAQWSES
jgi:histidinol dehydrogenase